MSRVRSQEEGVSSVIGAIMVFGLLVVTLTTVQVRFVPVWAEQREAALMQDVGEAFALLKSDVDRMAGNRTQAGVATPIPLGREGGFRFFGGGSAAGALAFRPSGVGSAGLQVASPRLTVLQQDGEATYAQGESWRTVTSGTSIPYVLAMNHLRLNVTTPPTPVPQQTQGHTELLVTDRDGARAGRFRLEHSARADDYMLDAYVFGRADDATPLAWRRDTYDRSGPPDHYFVNLLTQDLLFRDILRSAAAPYTLTMTSSGMQASYTAVYRAQAPGGGEAVSGGGGLVLPDYSAGLASGSLAFDARTQHFPAQHRVLEHGAVLLRQEEATLMVVPPALRVSATGGQVAIDWTVPALAGEGRSVGGSTTASVAVTPAGAGIDVTAVAPAVTITLPTEHPAAWAAHLQSVFAAAGLIADQFEVTASGSAVTVLVRGPSASAAIDDLSLRLRMAPVQVELRPGG